MKPWLKTALKIAAVLALIPVLTFTAIFGGGYAYGQIQRSRHQRTAQSCLNGARDELAEIVHAGKRVPELPAPLESMARDEGAWLFYLPFDRDKPFQWVPCGLMYCEAPIPAGAGRGRWRTTGIFSGTHPENGGKPMNITVYLGANEGSDPRLGGAVRELGRWIGQNGHALVYSGSKSGLMGALAESVLTAGGHVTGVEPQFFVDAGFVYDDIDELIVTRDMSERKAKMIELGDAFIAFPGGTGTLEEIAEVMSKLSLRHLDAPCILYNLSGYYDGLKVLLARMIETGLSSQERQRGICFAENLKEIQEILKR